MGTDHDLLVTPKKGAVVREPASGKQSGKFQVRSSRSGKFVNVEGSKPGLHGEITIVDSSGKIKGVITLDKVRKGLNFRYVSIMETALGVNRKQLASVLAIPTSTLNRRKQAGRLNKEESDRIARLAKLKEAALAMMQGDEEAAIQWLNTPLDILRGETPVNHADTELGAREVEDLIGRIRHGVFS